MKKYTLWSNLKFTYRPIWREKRSYIWDMICEMILTVMVPLIASALSALVIYLLGIESSALVILICIITAFLGYASIDAVRTYISQRHSLHNIEIRMKLFMKQPFEKLISMSLQQYESAEARLCYEKASMAFDGNERGIEAFLRQCTELSVGIIGLVTYSCIVGSIRLWIIALLLGLSILSSLVDNLPQWYYNKTKDQKAKALITMRYIDRTIDDVAGGKDIRIFSLKDWMIGKYDKAINETRRLDAKRSILAYIGVATTTTLNAGRDIACYLYLIYRLQHGMSMPEFVFYLGIIGGFSNWFGKVSRSAVLVKHYSTAVTDIRNYLELDEGIKKESLIPKNQFQSIEIVFDHVTFQYENSKKPVLKDVSFVLEAGEHKALVGLNGAGKSTMIKLLSGLYLPTSGDIYVNGINTRDLDLKEYYKHQAAMFQENFIMAYSIGENVALSDQWEEEKVWKCLQSVGLETKIRSLPEGLHTYLGKDITDQGISLSGGQIQKLILARALYRNPSLILLDEPTAAMDALAESQTYEMYNNVLNGITSLFISHRLASTKCCSEIYMLGDGVILEHGTHEELMQKMGKYYELFCVQSKYYEEGGADDVN